MIQNMEAVSRTSADKNRIEVRLAGEGGQGMILAGIILAEAASIYGGKNAVQIPVLRSGSARRRQ